MDRLACLELAAFPLQLLLRAREGAGEAWRGEPAAVLERDAPHALILWANRSARASGVLPGQRYATALGICARLRAGVVTPDEIAAGVAELVTELQRFSPEVEPCAEEPGVFWVDARGLEQLFGTPREWIDAVVAHVRAQGFEASAAVGFRRFTVYAAVKAADSPGVGAVSVFDDRAHESRVAFGVPLARLSIDPQVRDALAKLAVVDLGQFARLPAGGILERFGADAHRLHRAASGALAEDLAPAAEHVPLAAHVDLDLPESSLAAILAQAEELARPLCAGLERRGEAAAAITLRLDLEDRTAIEERMTPARPTCDVAWLARLLRLRFDGRTLAPARLAARTVPARTAPTRTVDASRSAGAVRIEVVLEPVPVRAEQATLFQKAKQRPPAAASKAFSALRASFGELAVVRARPASAHLPEKSFAWERCDALARAAPRSVATLPLVRCLFETPVRLPPRGRHEPDGWLLRGVTHGSVVKLSGPYRLSGGWWRAEVKRDYYFAELTGGEIAWIYYDGARRRWWLQGIVS